MTDGPPTTITDPVLGPLRSNGDDTAWSGAVTVHGRTVDLDIDTGLTEPSVEEQFTAIERARPQLPRVVAAEPDLLLAASARVGEVMSHQGPFPVEAFRATVVLQGIALHESGELYYDCSTFFGPGSVMTVFFEPDLSFGDVEIEQQ